MRTEIINVTPQMASDWLKKNTENRPLRRTVVSHFKEAIIRGEYVASHQGIAFAEDGTLLDGQHRLTAISELRDGSFPMVVTFDVPKKAFLLMDIGIKRTAADCLKIDKRVVEVARLAASMCGGSKSGITPTILIPFVQVIENIHESLIRFCSSSVRGWSSAPVRLAAVVSILNGADPDYVKQVYRALVLIDFESMPTIAQSLYRAQINGSLRIHGDLDTMSRCLKVFDYKKSGLTVVRSSDPQETSAFIRNAFSDIDIDTLFAKEQKEAAPKGAAKNIPRQKYLTAAR